MITMRQTVNAVLDYTIDITKWLTTGDYVAQVNFAIVPTGVAITNVTFTATTVSCFLGPGGSVTKPNDPTDGNIVTATITTNLGRTFPVSFTLVLDPYEP
jgi:hypothetical protein